MIRDKESIIVSPGEPTQTDAIWVDTNYGGKIRKKYINGQWVPIDSKGGGGGGTSDYEELSNLPKINNVTLTGNKSASDLGLATKSQGDKADTAYQKPSGGIPAEDIASGVIPDTSNFIQKSNTSGLVKNDGTIDTNTYLTQHQDISNYVQKSQTAGLLKNDGTVDTNTYLTSAHEVPAGGNSGQVLKKTSGSDYEYGWANASETLPSAYCTTAAATAAKKANCTLYNLLSNSYVHVLIAIGNSYAGALTLAINGTTAKPIYINGQASSSTNYTLPSGTYIVFYNGTNFYFRTDGKIESPSGLLQGYSDVHPAVATMQPNGGFLSNIVYQLGTITGSVTFALAAPTDNNIANYYYWTFDTSSTAPTITWPAGITWINGTAPTIDASKHYEISIIDNVASYLPNVSGGGGSSGVTDVTVGGTSVVSNGVAAIPSIPTVPTISTDIQTDKASDVKTASPKAVYDEVHPAVGSSQPAGGMLPNVMYKLGTLSGSVTISLAAATDNTIENEWRFTFTADSTAPTITWPNTITKWAGNSLDNGAPKVEASTYYEVSIEDGYGIFNAF